MDTVRKLLGVIALVAAALLTACGESGPDVMRGVVIERQYDDPDTTNDYCMSSVKVGDSSICVLWHESHDGSHFKLRLSCRVGETNHRSWVEVSQQTYDEFDFEDSYPDDGPCLIEGDTGSG